MTQTKNDKNPSFFHAKVPDQLGGVEVFQHTAVAVPWQEHHPRCLEPLTSGKLEGFSNIILVMTIFDDMMI